MITKERLEELIEENKMVYYTQNNPLASDGMWIDLTDAKIIHNDSISLNYKVYENYGYFNNLPFEWLYETEEDARWELEMSATRTETMKLPTWEKFCEFDELISTFRFSFISKDGEECLLYFFNGMLQTDPKEIILRSRDIDNKIIFEKVATKENYIEACKLCLRLFKGE